MKSKQIPERSEKYVKVKADLSQEICPTCEIKFKRIQDMNLSQKKEKQC
jgi:hypothetical protein